MHVASVAVAPAAAADLRRRRWMVGCVVKRPRDRIVDYCSEYAGGASFAAASCSAASSPPGTYPPAGT